MSESIVGAAQEAIFFLWLTILAGALLAVVGRILPGFIGWAVFQGAFLVVVGASVAFTAVALVAAATVIVAAPIAWPFKLLAALFLSFPIQVIRGLLRQVLPSTAARRRRLPPGRRSRGPEPETGWFDRLFLVLFLGTIIFSFIGVFAAAALAIPWPWKVLPIMFLGGAAWAAIQPLLEGWHKTRRGRRKA